MRSAADTPVVARPPLAPPKFASVVAQRLEDEIVALGWPVGSAIGSEAELLERFGVSRAVLREAVRILEHTGAAYMRRGPGGGLVVGQPGHDAVALAAGAWFSSQAVSVGEMIDARTPLMVAAALRAAEGGSDAELAAVREQIAGMEASGDLGADAFLELDNRFAAMSGNAAVTLFAQALAEIGRARLRGVRARLEPPVTAEDARRFLHGYTTLLDDAEAGRVDAAVRRTERLMDAVRDRLRDRGSIPRRAPVSIEMSTGKLGPRVAATMRHEIERAGWPIGTLLGSEAELVERYGVSRAILREAVRMLEHQGAVETRRGPGGGILVSRPDSTPIVRAARLVLEYDGVSAADLWEARVVVEGAAIRLAAERLDPQAVDALRHAVEEEADASPAGVREHVVHRQLAVASGNRPLLLFCDVLAELTKARVRRAGRARDMDDLVDGARRAHELIVDALVRGDADVAARRMERHLHAAARAV